MMDGENPKERRQQTTNITLVLVLGTVRCVLLTV